MRKWRLHIVGLGAIIGIVIIMFWVSGALNEPQKSGTTIAGSTRFTGERFIQIASASWGLNCNRTITNHNRRAEAAERDYNSDETIEPVTPVSKDNALLPLSRLCDGRLTCKIDKVKTSALGMDALPIRCNKELEITYRCFEIDKARELMVRQNKPLRIDCRKKEGEKN